MTALHLLSDFISPGCLISSSSPTYWYEGRCPQTGEWLRLPRTPMAEAIARGLMQHFANDARYSHEGKMYGVLLVETSTGEKRVLKAFSGLLNGNSIVAGWVPPIPGREQVALEEAQTLKVLEAIKQELMALQQIPERSRYLTLFQQFETQLQQLAAQHSQRKRERHHLRQTLLETLTGAALDCALEQLDEQSRRDGIERRQLKRQRNESLQPLKSLIEQADNRIRELKRQRKEISRQLQAQMHAHYWLTNFAGVSLSLQQLMPDGSLPTGTGDCCAPKLLHYAALHHLKPLAMAEFWWGPSAGDKIQGRFYGACVERCQPLMGFLLSGLIRNDFLPTRDLCGEHRSASHPPIHPSTHLPLYSPIHFLYADEWLIAVNKPAGLLAVPGRYSDRQDSVLSRLRHQLRDGMALNPIHRLDQDTSGILLIARDQQTHSQLSQQFQQRQVDKFYEAILTGSVTMEGGVIDLPLWGDPGDRPYQKVDWQQGKPSLTQFRVIGRAGDHTRVEFVPLTGRTHQLRVHAADRQGLGVPIVGDRLYGGENAPRLHLHARELHFNHPKTGQLIQLKTETPF
ncbi:pseudouridine synthase [Leptothermofonsia sp. ETS-13]|uniref:RluA family pseudouridine synthase n=1 Tax=Leptothermofonsia sp. ETS-13 TaxID=3035696 RepID=UPI003BA13B15